jgi:hypothetical protein
MRKLRISMNELDDRIGDLLSMEDTLAEVRKIKLVGILRRGLGRQEPGDFSESAALDGIAARMSILMKARLDHGNKKDLMIAIMPDTSPRGEAAAVWRTYKQPELPAR